jgi:methyl-accepting chemotaxis protein
VEPDPSADEPADAPMKQPDEATLGGESRRTNGSLEGIVAAALEAADGIETRVETVSELAEKQRNGIEDIVDHLQELSAADAVETVE